MHEHLMKKDVHSGTSTSWFCVQGEGNHRYVQQLVNGWWLVLHFFPSGWSTVGKSSTTCAGEAWCFTQIIMIVENICICSNNIYCSIIWKNDQTWQTYIICLYNQMFFFVLNIFYTYSIYHHAFLELAFHTIAFQGSRCIPRCSTRAGRRSPCTEEFTTWMAGNAARALGRGVTDNPREDQLIYWYTH